MGKIIIDYITGISSVINIFKVVLSAVLLWASDK